MKKLVFKLTLVAFSALTGLTVSAQTADEVIAKYITAIGGADNIRKINSMKIEGNVEVQGLEIPFTVAAVYNKGVRTDATFNGMEIIDIITPEKGWSKNPMAGKSDLQPLTDDEFKQKVDQLDIQDPLLDYAQKGSSVEALGKDEADGNEYFKIKLTTKNKNESVYFFDLKTNLIYKIEETVNQQGQEIKVEQKVFDYQDTEIGVKMPFKKDLGGMVLATKKVTFNVPVDESVFKGN